jgi:hypothetical protein
MDRADDHPHCTQEPNTSPARAEHARWNGDAKWM